MCAQSNKSEAAIKEEHEYNHCVPHEAKATA